jgi:hypothetical protein
MPSAGSKVLYALFTDENGRIAGKTYNSFYRYFSVLFAFSAVCIYHAVFFLCAFLSWRLYF